MGDLEEGGAGEGGRGGGRWWEGVDELRLKMVSGVQGVGFGLKV